MSHVSSNGKKPLNHIPFTQTRYSHLRDTHTHQTQASGGIYMLMHKLFGYNHISVPITARFTPFTTFAYAYILHTHMRSLKHLRVKHENASMVRLLMI